MCVCVCVCVCVCASGTVVVIVLVPGNPSVFILNKYEERDGGTSGSFTVDFIFFSNPIQTDVNYTWLFGDGGIVNEHVKFQRFGNIFAVYVTGGYSKEHTGVYTLVAETPLGEGNDSFTLQVFSQSHDLNHALNHVLL